MDDNRHPSRYGLIHIPAAVAERAATRFVVASFGCHISTYSTGGGPYSKITIHLPGGKTNTVEAHRAAWVHFHGEQIPLGMTVDHRPPACVSKRCVREDHLRLLTHFENSRRSGGRDWPLGECANGHSNDHLRMISGELRCALCRTGVKNERRRVGYVPS